MDDNELLKNVHVSDIPETYQPVISLIGLDNFLKLCQYAMGMNFIFLCVKVYYAAQETG